MAETEDLRRRLEVAETELKLVLEGSRKEVEELTEGGGGPKEAKTAPTSGAEGETVPTNQRSGRKSRRGDEFHPFTALHHVCHY